MNYKAKPMFYQIFFIFFIYFHIKVGTRYVTTYTKNTLKWNKIFIMWSWN